MLKCRLIGTSLFYRMPAGLQKLIVNDDSYTYMLHFTAYMSRKYVLKICMCTLTSLIKGEKCIECCEEIIFFDISLNILQPQNHSVENIKQLKIYTSILITIYAASIGWSVLDVCSQIISKGKIFECSLFYHNIGYHNAKWNGQ